MVLDWEGKSENGTGERNGGTAAGRGLLACEEYTFQKGERKNLQHPSRVPILSIFLSQICRAVFLLRFVFPQKYKSNEKLRFHSKLSASDSPNQYADWRKKHHCLHNTPCVSTHHPPSLRPLLGALKQKAKFNLAIPPPWGWFALV